MTNRRLLVVDDEPQFAAIVRKAAEEMGYEVSVATNAGAFKASYAAAPPDIVVLDIVMPDIDGIELTQWLVDNGCRSDLLLVTGHDRTYAKAARIIAEQRSAMRVRVLEKPVKLAHLRAAIAPRAP